MVDTGTKADGWGGLTCVVKERVLVVWYDKEKNLERHFGCLCEADHEERSQEIDESGNEYASCQGNLSLEIHRSEDAVMVKFHLPVTTAVRPKNPKHMYIVIPTSALSMTRDVESAVPENTRKHLPAASSYNRIHLELSDSKPPYAVMPKVQKRPRQIGKCVTGIARQQIICLKSLCMAKSWDAFLVADSAMQNQIDAACRLLSQGNIGEPSIDLGSIYSDGVHGCINNWYDYPYNENASGVPLPYDEIAPRYPQSPRAVSSTSPEPKLYWKTSPVPRPPATSHEHVTDQAAFTKRKKAEASDDDETVAHKHSRHSDGIATWHRKLDQARDLSSTEVDTDDEFLPLYDDKAPPADFLAEKNSEGVPADNPSDDHTSPLAHTDPPGADAPDCHAGSGELYFRMAQFLLYSLRIDPFTPSRYRKKLRQMGRHVYEQDDEPFHRVKRDCLHDLCRRSARLELSMHPNPAPLTEQVQELYIWLDKEISKEAYLYLGHHFIRLEEVALKEVKRASGWIDGARREFEIRKADFYTAAFWIADVFFEQGHCSPPPVLCANCYTRLARSYPSFR